jgi:hypothetical protein
MLSLADSAKRGVDMVPLPPVPRWVPYAAGALWLLLVVLAAVVGQGHDFASRLAGLVLGTAAPVAFAAAGGTLVVQRWQQREWERRTRYIVGALVDDSRMVLSGLAVTVYGVLVGGLPEHQRRRVGPLDSAFWLPRGEDQVNSMYAALVIADGIWSAVQVAYDDASERARAASRAHEELWARDFEELQARHMAMKERIAEVLGTPPPEDDAQEAALRPESDNVTRVSASTDDEFGATSEGPGHESPGNTLGIEADVTLQQELIRQRRAVSAECDATAHRLCGLLLELSSYTPKQSLQLVQKAVDLRRGIWKPSTASGPDAAVPSSPKSFRVEPGSDRSSAGSASIIEQQALNKAAEARDNAEHARREAEEALSTVSDAWLSLTSMFGLLGVLDEVYRLRYRDPSRGIERRLMDAHEAGNRELYRQDMMIADLQDASAHAADLSERLKKVRPMKPDPPRTDKG